MVFDGTCAESIAVSPLIRPVCSNIGGIYMKLILAIVSNDDSAMVSSGLTREGFTVTKLATTGGFLMAGNTTFIVGVDDDKVQQVFDVIAKHSRKRSQMMPTSASYGVGLYTSFPVEVTVGGATVFVLDVERFEKV
jgi:uncharacterized protein YaaQ